MSDFERLSDEILENVAGGGFEGSEHTTVVTDANFGRFINGANVVVLFGVSWSNTCVRASELIEECAAKYHNFRVGVFEITNNDYIKYKQGIKNVPTTIRYKFGTEVNRVEGWQRITNLFHGK